MSVFLPVSLKITDKKILIIGGGKVALQKTRSLKKFTSHITIVAAKICKQLKNMGFTYTEKEYSSADLAGIYLVYACTNNNSINENIMHDAHHRGLLVNVVDNPTLCDFICPAIYKNGNMTVAVSSNGKNISKSIYWRNNIKELLLK